MTTTVKNGDKVTVYYTGRFEDGKVFDSSVDWEPLDANHPLAGKALVFDLDLVSIA